MTMLVTQDPVLAYAIFTAKAVLLASAGGVIGGVIGGIIKGTLKEIYKEVKA